jgi:hypothetical protein
MIKVYTDNVIRKVEFFDREGIQSIVDSLKAHNYPFDIDPSAMSAYTQDGSIFALYYSGKPSTTDVDLSKVETDANANHLMSLRYNTSDNSIRIKIYMRTGLAEALGENIKLPKEYQGKKYVGHSHFLNEKTVTVYLEELTTPDHVCIQWTGLTFDRDTGAMVFDPSFYDTVQ